MKSWHLTAVLVILALLLGCGAGHPKVVSIAVSPATATAMSSSHATVAYSATGTFDDKTSRMLSVTDGLTWKSSNTAVATIDATGFAVSVAPGPGTIQATLPPN